MDARIQVWKYTAGQPLKRAVVDQLCYGRTHMLTNYSFTRRRGWFGCYYDSTLEWTPLIKVLGGRVVSVNGFKLHPMQFKFWYKKLSWQSWLYYCWLRLFVKVTYK